MHPFTAAFSAAVTITITPIAVTTTTALIRLATEFLLSPFLWLFLILRSLLLPLLYFLSSLSLNYCLLGFTTRSLDLQYSLSILLCRICLFDIGFPCHDYTSIVGIVFNQFHPTISLLLCFGDGRMHL